MERADAAGANSDMRRYWNTFTDEIGRLIVGEALAHAQGDAVGSRRSGRQFHDTSLTPDELYDRCLARLVDVWQQDPPLDAWQPLAMWSADARFQQGMFHLLLKAEETLGHLRVIRDGEGKPRVFVAKDVVSSYGTYSPSLADAEAARQEQGRLSERTRVSLRRQAVTR
jgi:MoxR-like ATPase